MKREEFLKLRLSKAEMRKIKAGSKQNGLNVSDYARKRIIGTPLTARKPKYRTQEDGDPKPEGRTAGFIAQHGRPPASEQEFLDWFLDQDVSDEMQAALQRSDERMARAQSDDARFAVNRERDEKQQAAYLRQIDSVTPVVRDPHCPRLDSEAQRVQALREAQAQADKETEQKTGIIL